MTPCATRTELREGALGHCTESYHPVREVSPCPFLSASKLWPCQQHRSMDWLLHLPCVLCCWWRWRGHLCGHSPRGVLQWKWAGPIADSINASPPSWVTQFKLHWPLTFPLKSLFPIGKLHGLPLSPELSVHWKYWSCTLLKIRSGLCGMR